MWKKTKNILLHLLCAVLFLLLPYFYNSNKEFLPPDFIHNPHERTYFITYLFMLGFLYFNYYALIPKLYFSKNYIAYFLLLLIALLGVVYLPNIISGNREPSPFGDNRRPPPPFENNNGKMIPPGGMEEFNLFMLFVTGIATTLFIRVNNRLQVAEKDKLNAELSFLKAQVNPHFLFNSLNSIYSLAINKNDKTPDAVLRLSELMRYVIKDANDDKVQLEKEVEYISNYIALQQYRLADTVAVKYTVDGDFGGRQISPLILISFVENAFKHGVNPDEISQIDIGISIKENRLRLQVKNNKVQAANDESGIGIANAIKRLDLLYAGKYLLHIDDKEKTYSTSLFVTI